MENVQFVLEATSDSINCVCMCVCVFQTAKRFACKTDEDCHKFYGTILSNGEWNFILTRHYCRYCHNVA